MHPRMFGACPPPGRHQAKRFSTLVESHVETTKATRRCAVPGCNDLDPPDFILIACPRMALLGAPTAGSDCPIVHPACAVRKKLHWRKLSCSHEIPIRRRVMVRAGVRPGSCQTWASRQAGRRPSHSAAMCCYSREWAGGAVNRSGQRPLMHIHSAGKPCGLPRTGCSGDAFAGAAAEGRNRPPGSQTTRRDRAHCRETAAGQLVLRAMADLNMLSATVIEDPVFIPSVE